MLHLFEILTDSAPITSDMSLLVLFFPALVRLGQEEIRVYKLYLDDLHRSLEEQRMKYEDLRAALVRESVRVSWFQNCRGLGW